ncbi:MAG: YebC/PmpR family DNA-binding transcriptional regulator [Firmicutes bacterium]|jgi:YebC/PmpR family DNA-binding regulatory protein|nr:YebC/PmpR family DNA-binding transcriptional regulator [Bacillota bacterium]
MAGHSKWSNIKRKKAKEDAGRAKAFTKMARKITIAAREGGGDPEANFRLRMAIEEARMVNMPNDSIQRAIKRGTGELDSAVFEEFVYEGYGPGGVALLIDVATDNRNRAASEIRYIFSRHGGNLGESGCVAWMFERKAVILVPADGNIDEDELMMSALEAGAEDMEASDGFFEIIGPPENLRAMQEALVQEGIPVESAELTMRPKNTMTVDESVARRVISLIEDLEDNDDVQNVYTNLDLTDELLAALEA